MPSGRSAIASPSRISSRAGSARTASTISGTAAVTSLSRRENTRTSSPALWTWTRAPSSLYSSAASPSSASASAASSALPASIGSTGRKSCTAKRASPAAPSASAARATCGRSPASITRPAHAVAGKPAARATASITSALQRALAELAHHEPEEKLPLVVVAPREQSAQELLTRFGGALAGRAGDTLQRRIQLRELDAGVRRRRRLGVGRGLQAGPAEAQLLLVDDAAEVAGGELDLVGWHGGEQLCEDRDLVAPPAGGGDAAGSVDERGELQWRDPARGRGIIAEQDAVRVGTVRLALT